MKTGLVSLVLCLMVSISLTAQSPPGTAFVEGIVQRLDSSDSLAGAAVELRASSDVLVAVADERGRFTFKDVPAGEYSLAATHRGYVRAEYGQRKVNGAGTKVTLKPGQQIKDVVLSLAPTAVIAGQIRGPKGLPTANVQVHALKYGYEEGRRVLQTISAVRNGHPSSRSGGPRVAHCRTRWNRAGISTDMESERCSDRTSPGSRQHSLLLSGNGTPGWSVADRIEAR